MGILLSLCCLDQDSDPTSMAPSSHPPCPTRIPPRAPPLSSISSTLTEFGSATIYTPEQVMQQMYGITRDTSQISVSQPQHPCFGAPRIKVIRPTYRTLPRDPTFQFEDAASLRVPKEGAWSRRQHVADIQF